MPKTRRKKDRVLTPYQQYSFTEYRRALDEVFRSVFFQSAKMRRIVWDSYIINLWDLVFYAINNRIDEIEYIKSIKDELLKDPKCKLRDEQR